MFEVECLEAVKKHTKKQTFEFFRKETASLKKSNLLFYILIMCPHLVYFVQFWSPLCPTTSKNNVEPQRSKRKAKKNQ